MYNMVKTFYSFYMAISAQMNRGNFTVQNHDGSRVLFGQGDPNHHHGFEWQNFLSSS
jgi:hypothetical protein